MKNKILVLVVLLVAGVVFIAFMVKGREEKKEAAEQAVSTQSAAAPSFELRDLDGKAWRLSDLRGKVVLVTFWATWCPSCKEENPSIQRFLDAQKGTNEIVYLSVLVQDKPEAAREYMKANGFSFPVLVDDGTVSARYGITGVPETFIIDKKGAVKERVIGPAEWDSQQVRTFLSGLTAGGA